MLIQVCCMFYYIAFNDADDRYYTGSQQTQTRAFLITIHAKIPHNEDREMHHCFDEVMIHFSLQSLSLECIKKEPQSTSRR